MAHAGHVHTPRRVRPQSALSPRHVQVTAPAGCGVLRLRAALPLSTAPTSGFSQVWAAAVCLESWAQSGYRWERGASLSLPETPAWAWPLPSLGPRTALPRRAAAGRVKAVGGPQTRRPLAAATRGPGTRGRQSLSRSRAHTRPAGPGVSRDTGCLCSWPRPSSGTCSSRDPRSGVEHNPDQCPLRTTAGRSRVATDSSGAFSPRVCIISSRARVPGGRTRRRTRDELQGSGPYA